MGILYDLNFRELLKSDFINTTQSLQDKIDQLNKQAWEERVSNSTHAMILSKEAVDLAQRIDYVKGKAEGLRTVGFCHIRISRHHEALQYLEESMKLFEVLNDLRGQSDVFEYLGIIQRSFGDYEASLQFIFKGLELRQQTGYTEGESLSHYHLGVTYKYLGNYEKALDQLLQSLTIARSNDYWIAESYALNHIGLIYFETGNYSSAVEYYQQSLAIRQRSGDKWGEAGCLDNIGFIYFKMKDYEEANSFCSQGLRISESVGDQKGQANCLFHLGYINEHLEDYQKTVDYCKQALEIRREIGDKKGEAEILLFLAELSLKENYYQKYGVDPYDLLNIALKLGEEIKSLDLLSNIHLGFYRVSKHFDRHKEALDHLEKNMTLEKEVHSAAIQQKILNLEITHRVETSRKETEIFRLRNIELANLYEETNKQKDEIALQKNNIEKTLAELKETQSQLIQREKMASLGELTAGIAHEIQNPLNFVNNFSELNIELIDEMEKELEKGNKQNAKMLADDIKQNLEKTNYHGKRADAIVKGMLQHSHSSTGQKELSNINELADEYLRLAYHGLRAKDKSFNATIQTDFDNSIGNVYIVPQNIGRVFLNLFNNAFYSVIEKKKDQPDGYEPVVLVSTIGFHSLPANEARCIEIKVRDNGIGIPQKLIEKIFQPFFTTKAPGQGTGLGLSLSYDIITKEHGGELKVNTKEGEYAEFIILLPVNETV